MVDDKIWLSWIDIDKYCSDIADQVSKSYNPDAIIGIGLGGNFPTALIAKQMGIKYVGTFNMHSYDAQEKGNLNIVSRPDINLKDKKVLIIDDIHDSGDTTDCIKEILKSDYEVDESNMKTAVIIYRKKEKESKPDFFAREVDKWVVFPWEVKEKGYWD